jgi:hypothetical protein
MANYYRNTIQVTSDQGDEIDATSLWIEMKGSELLLFDDDLYATIMLDKNFDAAL